MSEHIEVGDRFDLSDEAIHGTVSEVIFNDECEIASIIVDCDDGMFAAVDVSLIEKRVIH